MPFLRIYYISQYHATTVVVTTVTVTFSRSGSSSARAKLLLSITEEAATSNGVEPLISGHAREIEEIKIIFLWSARTAHLQLGNTNQQRAVFTYFVLARVVFLLSVIIC